MSRKKKEQLTDSIPEATQTEPKQDTIDPLSVSLTVLIFCSDESLLRYTLRSLHLLRGITAEVKVTVLS